MTRTYWKHFCEENRQVQETDDAGGSDRDDYIGQDAEDIQPETEVIGRVRCGSVVLMDAVAWKEMQNDSPTDEFQNEHAVVDGSREESEDVTGYFIIEW
uniref:Uncharacterized protein n=1 Tax=Caenorhabditis japonica TaxID=281687 RepID=A0A8R1HQ57_CAEJA